MAYYELDKDTTYYPVDDSIAERLNLREGNISKEQRRLTKKETKERNQKLRKANEIINKHPEVLKNYVEQAKRQSQAPPRNLSHDIRSGAIAQGIRSGMFEVVFGETPQRRTTQSQSIQPKRQDMSAEPAPLSQPKSMTKQVYPGSVTAAPQPTSLFGKWKARLTKQSDILSQKHLTSGSTSAALGSFSLGAAVGLADVAQANYQLIRHPISTTKNLFATAKYAVQNPTEVRARLRGASSNLGQPMTAGRIVGNIGGFKLIGKLGELGTKQAVKVLPVKVQDISKTAIAGEGKTAQAASAIDSTVKIAGKKIRVTGEFHEFARLKDKTTTLLGVGEFSVKNKGVFGVATVGTARTKKGITTSFRTASIARIDTPKAKLLGRKEIISLQYDVLKTPSSRVERIIRFAGNRKEAQAGLGTINTDLEIMQGSKYFGQFTKVEGSRIKGMGKRGSMGAGQPLMRTGKPNTPITSSQTGISSTTAGSVVTEKGITTSLKTANIAIPKAALRSGIGVTAPKIIAQNIITKTVAPKVSTVLRTTSTIGIVNKNIARVNQSNALKAAQSKATKQEQALRPIQLTPTKPSVSLRSIQTPALRQIPALRGMQASLSSTLKAPVTVVPSITGTGGGFAIPKGIGVTPPPPNLFKTKKSPSNKKLKSSFKIGGFKTGYTPSIGGQLFKVKGPKLSKRSLMSGIVVRPIIK